jgi:hypothetical protein
MSREVEQVAQFKIVSTEPAWSTNQDRKLNYHDRHRRTMAWQAAARQGWMLFAPPELRKEVREGIHTPMIVQVDIPFGQKRKRDPHNYCGTVVKAVIDGLVKQGVWPDDTPEWVGHREPIPILGREGFVTLYEWWD